MACSQYCVLITLLILSDIVCCHAQVSKSGPRVIKEPKRTPVKRATPQKTRRHHPQNRVGLTLTKSPVINLTKPSSKHLPRVKRPPPQVRPSAGASLTGKEKGLNQETSLPASSLYEEQQNKDVVPKGDGPSVDTESGAVVEVRRSPRKNKWRGKSEKDGKRETLKSVG